MSRVTDAMRRTGHLAETPDVSTDDHASVLGRYTAEVNPPATEAATPAPRFEVPAAPRTEFRRPEAPARPEPVPANRSAHSVRRINGDVTGGRNSGDEVRIVDAVWALYRRKWLIATVVAVALAGAAVYNRTTTPVYEARARLLLEPNIPDVVPFRASNADQGRLDYYLTQLEVLKSQSIARKTLENSESSRRRSAAPAGPGQPAPSSTGRCSGPDRRRRKPRHQHFVQIAQCRSRGGHPERDRANLRGRASRRAPAGES